MSRSAPKSAAVHAVPVNFELSEHLVTAMNKQAVAAGDRD